MIKDILTAMTKDIALGLIDCSYWICLFISMLGIIFYAIGVKKGGKVTSISLVIYVITQAMKLAIRE